MINALIRETSWSIQASPPACDRPQWRGYHNVPMEATCHGVRAEVPALEGGVQGKGRKGG